MPGYGGRGGREKGFPSPEWIGEDGLLDATRFPVGGLLVQAFDREHNRFRSACVLLASLCAAGRTEAGVYLLGLLRFYQHDLDRLSAVVESLGAFPVPQSAEALVGELRRVKSSNATRQYLELVIASLLRFPPELVEAHIAALAEDKSFSIKMRRKLEAALQDLRLRSARRNALLTQADDGPSASE